MIQRIQTVYLIIVALLMVALYIWFPALHDEANEIVLDRSALWVMIPIFASIGLAIISILNFKKRQLQFVINRLNIILNFVLLGVFVYRSLSVSGETFVSVKGIGVLFPVISIVFLVLANKAIKRDEDLVKSVDRLR
jgi:cytochrome bd-type quinol oxidase subunit 2